MAFNENTAVKRNKNQYVARLVSKKSGKTVSWINVTPEFSRSVFGEEPQNVTAQQALDVLPKVLTNDFVEVSVTDITAEQPTVEATEF
jgi:hypothetical protein